nr:ATPase [Furfurilactobacillus milii]
MHKAFETKTSVHVETTLAGVGKTQVELINLAHKYGFEVTLLYVTLDSPQTTIDRVNVRVQKGGHRSRCTCRANQEALCTVT